MTENSDKNQRLKKFVREQVRTSLLKTGRRLVVGKGAEFLTARKLSEASNTSVGTIYNTFATMEQFIAEENMQTLDELYAALSSIIPESNPYINISRYADVFSAFVISNRQLWILLYREHLFNATAPLPRGYLRRVCRIEALLSRQAEAMFGALSKAERRTAMQVLGMALFALSGFLATEPTGKVRKMSKSNICKLLLNTYLAGLEGLKRVKK